MRFEFRRLAVEEDAVEIEHCREDARGLRGS
jgi:hypothetical protein